MGVHAFAALALLLAGHQQAPALHASTPCLDAPAFTCSILDVPLDRTGGRPGTLHLRVAAADNVQAPRGVLLVIAGGPGQPATPLVARFAARALAAERKAYRIVAYDQRGTGAGALSCAALQGAMGSSDLAPPPAAAVRACARKLGARRQFFGTDDVVADMEALRRALGVDRWTLDGISYGTFVGERYALAHPQRVQRLVLDSVVPHVGETDLGIDELRAARRVLRMVCGDACVRDLAATVRRYRNGPRLLDALTVLSIADPTYRTLIDVPEALHAAARGDRLSLDLWLRAARTWQTAQPKDLDQGLHASTLCADWRYPWGSSAAPLAGRQAKLQRAVARLPVTQLYPFDRATASGNGFVRQCLPWPPSPPTRLATGKIRVPALLVNGDHDLSTPLEWAREELHLTTNAKLVIVRGAGHSTQSRASTGAARRAVAAFLLG
ncbi:MAG TPA: alpha/beta fold hydrolase [Gaiellaceae bacterium]|nr:alpha/beta fold hydrolase [Gaiellaceae bacterium]